MRKNYQILSIVLLTLIFFIPNVLVSQNANRHEGKDKLVYQWYLNLNGGITQAYGDILAGSWHGAMLGGDKMGYAGGLRLGKHISPVFGVYGTIVLGQLKGESGEDTKNMYFETDMIEYYLGGTLSLSNLIGGYKPRLVNVYLTAGIGLMNFTPNAYYKDTDPPKPVQPDKNDPDANWDNTTEAVVPTGAGIDFRFNDRWDLNFETTVRWMDSDKLDGYKSGEKNDAYFNTSLGLGYSFGQGGKGPKMAIETEPAMLSLHGDSIPVEIKGTFPESFNKKAVVDFTPVLVYGDQTKQLETMYFQGEDVTEEYQKSGAVVMPSTGGSFSYRTYVKYEPGMEVCELYVEPMTSAKGKTPNSLGDRKIADGLIMTSKRLDNTEKLLLADHGYKRDIVSTKTGTIYYVVNRHQLNLGYKLNKDSGSKENLGNMKSFITKGWEIKSIDINAWASPEGEESFNQGLSQRRSETAQKYAQDVYDKYIKARAKELGVHVDELKKDITYNLSANGEDWNGFMTAIENSNIKDKNIIANVVNSQTDPTKREQEIRNMAVIYKEIETDILPPLRRADINVNCYEPAKTDEKIAQFAVNSPDSLRLSELLYAGTLTEDPNQRLAIYKTVIATYPDDWRGYNNAGYASSELNDFTASEAYFAKAKSIAGTNGLVLNNTGAMAAKEKNFSEAKKDYLAAQKQGVDVSYNMGIIKIAEGNYNGAINSFGSTKCDYNLALAHTLSGNYNAATSTLNCAEKTAQAYYLQAVIGARTNNSTMVFENLTNAIAENASYRDTVKDDMEFIKYYNNPDFQNAIK